MNALAFAHPVAARPSLQPHQFAQFLHDGLVKSGCIRDRRSAERWLILRTRDTAQLNCFLDALFPNG